MDLEVAEKPNKIEIKSKKIIMVPLPQFYLGVLETKKGREYAIKESSHYIYLKDVRAEDKTRQIIIAGYFFVLAILLLLYTSIRRSIYPIKELEKKVLQFGRGDFNVDCSSDREDEIGRLANSFDMSIRKLKALMDGRMLFLRNAAHELKTPLTKGMIALELPDTPKKTQTFKNVFKRLNDLVTELLNIEKITSGNMRVIKKPYSLEKIIENVEKLLFLEKGDIQKEVGDIKIRVDFDLFSLALKNLVDNGLKYGEKGSCHIVLEDRRLMVVSRGEKLSKDFKEFLEPFSKENGNKEGFGLGLFIVNYILNAHGYTLDYKAENGNNIFYFDLRGTSKF